MAKNILKENDPEEILAAILKYSFDKELDETRYREIGDVSVDRKGTTRLFVSLGKKDGMMPRKLVKMINNESSVPAGRITDVKILDSFSFLTVSFEDAEVILKSFSGGKGKAQATVQKANGLNDK